MDCAHAIEAGSLVRACELLFKFRNESALTIYQWVQVYVPELEKRIRPNADKNVVDIRNEAGV
jgi:hypothetical protein